jgi:hypothetical protein
MTPGVKLLIALMGIASGILIVKVIDLVIALFKIAIKHRAKKNAEKFLDGKHNLNSKEIQKVIDDISSAPNIDEKDERLVKKLKQRYHEIMQNV